MASPKLSISRLISVSVAISQLGAQSQSTNTMLLLTTNNAIDMVERYRMYTSSSAVALDFGENTNTYKAASLYFSQTPRPKRLMIGKWARSATEGGLRCAPLDSANDQYTDWTNNTNAGFGISVDGGAVQNITGLNFATVTSMDDVAAIISAALTGATCVYEPTFNRFTFRSNTTGTTSSVSFLSDAASGDNIADNLNGRSNDSGAYQYPGNNAEGAGTVTNFFDSYYGQLWYALQASPSTALSDAHHLNFAAAVEALTNKHMYFATTQDAATLLPSNTTDLASQLKALGYLRTLCVYSSTNAYASASVAGKLMSVNYDLEGSALTLMFKQMPGVEAELLNETQATALADKNCNVFVGYDNDTNILQYGTMANGQFADTVHATDWLATVIQTDLWNINYTTPTKVPQTDAGMQLFVTAAEARCGQAVRAGIAAPGVWNSQGFGLLNQGDYLGKGFYVFCDKVQNQPQTDRDARKAMPLQIALKLAGAVHSADIQINVNP